MFVKKMQNSKYAENVIVILISSIVSFCFLLRSPLIGSGLDTGTDSSVFKTIALMMGKGFMPYKDSFDHKGPLLYIINWLGNKVFPYWGGVWVIEFLFMILTIFMSYKTARLMCKKITSVIVVFVSFSMLYSYFDGGNLTEEYAMTLISVALFIFLDYLENSRISRLRLTICGFCLGGTLLLRPNMIAVWAVMCTAIFIKIVINKEWAVLREFVGWFVLGIMIITIPIIVWLATNGALEQCWRDYIVFNNLYISGEGGRALFVGRCISFFRFFSSDVYLISFLVLIFVGRKREYMIYIAYMLIAVLFVCLSARIFPHYGMVLVPVVIYPLSLGFSEIENINIRSIPNVMKIIMSVYCLNTIIMPVCLDIIKTIPYIYVNKDAKQREEITSNVTKIIVNNTSDDEAISVYGNWDIIYVLSDRKHATRYSYQFPVGQVMPEIMNEYRSQLQDELPNLIVVQEGHYDDNIIDFLNKNEYQLFWSQNGDSMDGALIYTREKLST